MQLHSSRSRIKNSIANLQQYTHLCSNLYFSYTEGYLCKCIRRDQGSKTQSQIFNNVLIRVAISIFKKLKVISAIAFVEFEDQKLNRKSSTMYVFNNPCSNLKVISAITLDRSRMKPPYTHPLNTN